MVGYNVKNHSPKIDQYMEKVRAVLQPHYDDVHAACHALQQQANKS
jgi:hypothetical protein